MIYNIHILQSFFGTKPTDEELAERKTKREAAVGSRLQVCVCVCGCVLVWNRKLRDGAGGTG